MKTVLVLSILFSAIALPAFGELTDADLDKIRLIVKEEVKAEITAVRQEIADVRQELKAEIAGSEKRIKDYIDVSIEGVDKRFSAYNWVIYILMPLIVVAIGAPTSVMAWRSGRDRSLERQVETLAKEIELLKEQRIVNP